LTRLGLLGGTFDPPHYGHLIAAQEALWQLDLARVLFLPARQNPLKRDEPATAAELRCAMVQCAIQDEPRFELSRLDVDRPGPSFTVDVLRALAKPERELFFLVGADILPELPRWHAPLEILELARLVVVNRPGAPVPDPSLLEQRLPGAAARITVLNIPGVEISSSDVRARVSAGRPIRYLTHPRVEQFIADQGLYR
jgi:nicotinate-nucleotide adenylyltransferase